MKGGELRLGRPLLFSAGAGAPLADAAAMMGHAAAKLSFVASEAPLD